MSAIKETILSSAIDTARNFAFYDRKDDEDLTQEKLIETIKNGDVSIDEIAEAFKQELIQQLL